MNLYRQNCKKRANLVGLFIPPLKKKSQGMQKLKVSKQFVALKTRQEENSEDLISKPGYSMPFICSNILCFKRGADLI